MYLYVVEQYEPMQKNYKFIDANLTLIDAKIALKCWQRDYPKDKFRLMLYTRGWVIK